MKDSGSQDIESATTLLEVQPDSKTRRYDRQLRLWASSGQTALEKARVLLLSGSATSTSILKNLVLPGIGHFTILDHALVGPEDAGNNFFLEASESIGKSRAEEAVRLLSELNDQVEGRADTRNIRDVLADDPAFLTSFSIIIAHNLEPAVVRKLSDFLWSDDTYPPLFVANSAGFIAEFSIQYHEHCIVESHSDAIPSLRIDKPFPALLEYAQSLDFKAMDPTEHSHVPYVVILVRAFEDWKAAHDGSTPKTYTEKQQFKQQILDMRLKYDEENYEEAESQAYRCWMETTVPSEIAQLFQHPTLLNLTPHSQPFYHLLSALQKFTQQPPNALPLTSTLPDMKSNTKNYIHLQTLYKRQADAEKATFKDLLQVEMDDSAIDIFVKNAHGLKILHGKKWGVFDSDKAALASALASPDEQERRLASAHLAISALSSYRTQHPDSEPTLEALAAAAKSIQGGDALPDEFNDGAGEIARAPSADLPTSAAFLGGMVAQEVIKMITKQYVPINGYCVIDLVEMRTGIVG